MLDSLGSSMRREEIDCSTSVYLFLSLQSFLLSVLFLSSLCSPSSEFIFLSSFCISLSGSFVFFSSRSCYLCSRRSLSFLCRLHEERKQTTQEEEREKEEREEQEVFSLSPSRRVDRASFLFSSSSTSSSFRNNSLGF